MTLIRYQKKHHLSPFSEKSLPEIKRSEEPIPVPKELLILSFKPEDIQYETKEMRLIQSIKVDIEALAGLWGEEYRETTKVIEERSILSLNKASIKVFLSIWSSANMDAECGSIGTRSFNTRFFQAETVEGR